MSVFDWRGPSTVQIERPPRGRPRLYDDEQRKQRHREAALRHYYKKRARKARAN